jgi:hypothetical protein
MKVAASLPLCATATDRQDDADDQQPQSEGSPALAYRRNFAAGTGGWGVFTDPGKHTRCCGAVAWRWIDLVIGLCFRGPGGARERRAACTPEAERPAPRPRPPKSSSLVAVLTAEGIVAAAARNRVVPALSEDRIVITAANDVVSSIAGADEPAGQTSGAPSMSRSSVEHCLHYRRNSSTNE